MATKVIKKSDIYSRKSRGDGASGEYRIFNRAKTRGIKIFFSDASTLHEVYRDSAWEEAKCEFKGLKLASKAGLAPKPYKLVLVKEKSYYGGVQYRPAVIMQHIKGHTYDTPDDHNDIDTSDELAALNEKLTNLGIHHGDLHGENAIICHKTQKLMAIDFAFCNITKPKRIRRRRKK